jgi:hypothetical protein
VSHFTVEIATHFAQNLQNSRSNSNLAPVFTSHYRPSADQLFKRLYWFGDVWALLENSLIWWFRFQDNNGTIENEELRGFLKDLLELVKKVGRRGGIWFRCEFRLLQDYDAQDLLDFEETILRGVDYNQDGKINKKELTMILLAIAKHNQEEEASA